MKQRFTLYIFNHRGSTVTEACFTPNTFLAICLLFSLLLFLGCYFLVDYIKVKRSFGEIISQKNHLETKLSHQLAKTASQQNQIRYFASEIDSLKTQISELSDFEQKIRVIADLEKSEGAASKFGVGGPLPEDLTLDGEEMGSELLKEMDQQIERCKEISSYQLQNFESLLKNLEHKQSLLAATPSIRPIEKGWISSSFGYRISPFTGKREMHRGLDIASRLGSAVFATADGIVKFAGTNGSMGKTITIDHGFGMKTRYGHLHKILAKRGQRVKRGDVIAELGNTGRSTGPHIHYEVSVKGKAVNPADYILN